MAQRYQLKDKLQREIESLGDWPSNSQFPFHLFQEKNSFNEIRQFMLKRGQLNIFLPKTVVDKECILLSLLNERLEELGIDLNRGLAHVTKSLTVLLNLEPIQIPNGILWELFYCVPDRPCTLLCVVRNISDNEFQRYILNLTRNALCKMRKFTDEHFSIIYGLITEIELQSRETFQTRLETIEDETSVFCNLDSLQVTDEKCESIIKAFLASIAVTDLVTVFISEDSDKDCLWFLTLQQFRVLVENIDGEMVILESVERSGATFILVEVARRLGKIGSTLLSVEGKSVDILRKKNIANHVLSSEELRSEPPANVKHIVGEGLSLQDVHHVKSWADNKPRVWLLNPKEKETADIVQEHQTWTSEKPINSFDKEKFDDEDVGNEEEGYASASFDWLDDSLATCEEDEETQQKTDIISAPQNCKSN